MGVVSYTGRLIYPQEKSTYRRLVGPQSRSGRGGEEKNSHPLPGLEPPIIEPVAQRYTTELSRLTLCVSKNCNFYNSLFHSLHQCKIKLEVISDK
jgi:hypothetical protein